MTRGKPANQAWRAEGVPFDQLPGMGADAFLARLRRGEFADAFPLLNVTQPAERAASAFCDRAAVAAKLAEGNARLGNELDEPTVQAIAGRGVMVIAGQQPGLLLGPMFTLLKAITAVNAAERLGRVMDVPVVPAFWIASEDHDIEEVNRVTAGERKLVLDHAALHRPGARPPVGKVSLDEHREQIARFIAEAAAESRHGDAVRRLTERLDFTSYATQFGQMLARLMRPTPLVLVDPAWLREQTGPVLAEAARRWEDIDAALASGRQRLSGHGLSSPLESVKIFGLDKWDGREALTVAGREAETAAAIEQEPWRYSPSAALRPVVQDAVLPTIATVGGPTELLYLWEIEEIYAAMGLDRSRLLPRLSATIVDARTQRRAQRLGLTDAAAILHVRDQLTAPAAATDDAADDADLRELEALAQQLTARLAELDEQQERKTIDKAIGSIRYRVDRVTRRVARRRAESRGVGRANLERVAAAVQPHNQLQERGASVLEMVGRFGFDLVTQLRALDVGRLEHRLLWAQQEPAGAKPVKELKA